MRARLIIAAALLSSVANVALAQASQGLRGQGGQQSQMAAGQAAPAADFATIKANHLARLQQHLVEVQTIQACVNASQNFEQMRACHHGHEGH
jgi:uncharacterized protein YdeI (BOF family)